jgi:aryl-alcohol dehydrogenase-like predicted oxidoreductase
MTAEIGACRLVRIPWLSPLIEVHRMQYRKLGPGLEVSALGLGCMSLGIANVYTSSVKSDEDAVKLIHRALDLGVNFLDSANIYGDSELKLGKALQGRRQQAIVATKFGIDTATVGAASRSVNGKPEYVLACCDKSLKRLGIDTIDLYYQHRVDTQVPIEETVGAMAQLVRQGKVRYLGLSEASSATIRRAHKVHPIAALQSEYSLWTRDIEAEILPTLQELNIGLVAYSPISRGMLGGRFNSVDDLAADDWRRGSPRFQGENFAKNLALVDQVKALASEKGCTPAQLALAWLLAKAPNVVPIPGTSSTARLEENAKAADVKLTAREVEHLGDVLPQGAAAGARYNSQMMGSVNR